MIKGKWELASADSREYTNAERAPTFFFLPLLCDHHLGVCTEGFGRGLRLLFLQRSTFLTNGKSFLSPHAITTLSFA